MPITNKPEILAPAGTLEKLKVAFYYGADAVYIGGERYGLRSRAGNFTFEEMAEGVEVANRSGGKVYVAANMVTHEGDEEGAGEFFKTLQQIGIAAVIVSDPALIPICVSEAPGLPIHLSTQASTTNYQALNFWHEEGLERVVLAREVSMEELRDMRQQTDVEIEVFIHGAMCIAYSGRCVLSNHMSGRDANRGGCTQSCRWQYQLVEAGDDEGLSSVPFSMNSVDMAMIRHIPDLIESGVQSFKIEGRMKSIHYVSTVTNVYRQAVDAYCRAPEQYEFMQEWEDELWKVAQRELATGFYYGQPDHHAQIFGKPRVRPRYKFAGHVLAYDAETGIATIEQRNHFAVGDDIEFYGPGLVSFRQTIEEMWDEDGEPIERAPHAKMIVRMKVHSPVKPYYMMRQKISNTRAVSST